MKKNYILLAVLCTAMAALAFAGVKGKARPTPDPSRVATFSRDIAPIVYSKCAQCHHAGGAGPFPLISYQDVRQHGRQIAVVTAARFMPPWLPDTTVSHFLGELRLSPEQIATIQRWVKQGMQEGSAADLPKPPSFPDGWQLGKPDMVVTAPAAWTLPAAGIDTYRNFVLRVPIQKTVYVRAVEIRPGPPTIVHHANLLVDRKHASRALDGKDGQPGFPGMDVALESDVFEPDSHFIFWKPGTLPPSTPDNMSWRIDPGTDLVLNVHMRPSGKPEQIQPSVGLYFTPHAPTVHPMLVQLEADEQLNIPGGLASFKVGDDFKLPVDVDVLAIYPHAHYLGKDLQGYATLPNGQRRWLLHIRDWDPNWQGIYQLVKPIHLGKGSVISMRYTYDNSAENVRNPNHPPKRVTAGNSSTDEMAHLWLQVLPRPADIDGRDARMLIQEALMRHKLSKDPNDFVAHFNLGATLFSRHQVDQAIAEFEQAIQTRPHSAVALNSLGAALQARGAPTEAEARFRQAVDADPNYADAHYNLASALAAQGDIAAALTQFQEVVKLNPEDADAEANLGTAYAQMGNLHTAEQHYRRALAINPQNALALENLQVLQQQLGQKQNSTPR